MRHGTHYAPPSLLSPPPSPALNAASAGGEHPMLVSIFLALFLPCAGMSAVFIIYICLLWYATNYRVDNSGSSLSAKQAGEKGLSVAELEKVPKVTGKELVLGTECAVCLDEIEDDQLARMVPGCHHGFHLQCADTWLSKNSVCPVCRAKLQPMLLDEPSDDNKDNPC